MELASLTLCFLIFGTHLPAVLGSPCSQSDRAANLGACLVALKAQLFNKTSYWFGSQYATDCPNGPAPGDLFCANPRAGEEDSLAHRLFPDSLNLTLIDRFLEVTYLHGAGSYRGCGVTVNEPAWEKDIDPLTPESVTPWNTRLVPDLKFNSSGDEYFTIFFINVGLLVPHAVYVNVQGDTITEANEVKSYVGPFNPLLRREPFMFLLFKQPGPITVSQQWISRINTDNSGATFSVPDFARDYSLTGPVALNWISVVGDLYSAGLAESREWVYSCPQFVSRAMDRLEGGYLPKPASLSVSVDVEFHAPALDFTLCCQHHRYPARNFTANPFAKANETVFTGTVRTEADPVFSFRRTGYYQYSKNFGGEFFALVSLDPDTPVAIAGTKERPILHQLVINIRDGDVSTGDVVVPYLGPSPPDPSIHNYWFLLYKQKTVMDKAVMTSYAGSCPTIPRLFQRCLFNINQLVEDKNLTLLGANVIRSTFDEYVKYQRLDPNDTSAITEACRGVPGFVEQSCPASCAVGLTFTGVIVASVVTLIATVV